MSETTEPAAAEVVAPVHANAHAALLGAMEEVGYVQKSGRVTTGPAQYNFAGEADLIHALRPAMLRHGLTFYVAAVEDVIFDSYQTKGGSTMRTTTARYTGRFTHAPSGTFFDAQAVGEGADTGDKSAPKAATIGLKYLLRQTFCIETGDDPDKDASVERAAPQGRQEASGRSGATQGRPAAGGDASGAPSGAQGAGNDPKPDWPVPPCPACGQTGTRRTRATGKQPSFACGEGCVEEGRDGKQYPKSYWRASDPSLKAAKASLTDYLTRNGMGGDAENARAEQAGIAQALGIPESSREWAQDHASRFIDACKAGGPGSFGAEGTGRDADIPF